MCPDAPRRISASALESAARIVYDVSVRTPLVGVDLPGPLSERVEARGGPSALYLIRFATLVGAYA